LFPDRRIGDSVSVGRDHSKTECSLTAAVKMLPNMRRMIMTAMIGERFISMIE